MFGRTISCLAGFATYNEDLIEHLRLIFPPESYDSLLRVMIHAAPASPISTPWTARALAPPSFYSSAAKCKYKPIDRKVQPISTYMPDPLGQEFKPIKIPILPSLPLDPPAYADFEPTERLTQERLDKILRSVPNGFLSA
jgi:hypothetical protein